MMILKVQLKRDNSDFGLIPWVLRELMLPIYMMMSNLVFFYVKLPIKFNQDVSTGKLSEIQLKISMICKVITVSLSELVKTRIMDLL